jgi:hypothetical protein
LAPSPASICTSSSARSDSNLEISSSFCDTLFSASLIFSCLQILQITL